jgi:hypothetical protein
LRFEQGGDAGDDAAWPSGPTEGLKVLLRVVLRIALPGAPTWTVRRPGFENDDSASVRVVEATRSRWQIDAGGILGVRSLSFVSFPPPR